MPPLPPSDAPIWQVLLFMVVIPGVGFACREIKLYLRDLMGERDKFMEYLIEKEKQSSEERRTYATLFTDIRNDLREHSNYSKGQTAAIEELAREVKEMHVTVGRNR